MGDVRLGEGWTKRQRVRNGVLFWGALGVIWLTKRLGYGRLRKLGWWIGRVAHEIVPRARRRAAERLKAAYPQGAPVGTVEVFCGLGEELADAVALMNEKEEASRGVELTEQGEAVLRRAIGRGRGVIFVSAHLGPMERMASVVAERLGSAVSTVARESYDPRFTLMIERMRERRGVRTIYRGKAGAGLAIMRALRGNGIVGMPMDLGGREMSSVGLRFLGEESRIPTGPARIGIRLGASFVVGTPRRGRNGYEIEVTEEDFGGKSPKELGVDLVTQRLTETLERRIRQLPDRWVWIHGS